MDFSIEKRGGYNRDQVEQYVEKIRSAYQDLYAQYQELLEHSKVERQNLEEQIRRAQSAQPARSQQNDAEIASKLQAIGQALADAEMMRQRIVQQAHQEAGEIRRQMPTSPAFQPAATNQAFRSAVPPDYQSPQPGAMSAPTYQQSFAAPPNYANMQALRYEA
ncbi:MAG: DivIVA domain-containing protein [Oscillospiraceae bacterium]|jgi:cell division septum initiation protein DivIVA|nr:DivIVA domain-containing protein [Oscillospiraceae bacterium]